MGPSAPQLSSASGSVEVRARHSTSARGVLTPEAEAFLVELQREFGLQRASLLQARKKRQLLFDEGILPDFLPETAAIRKTEWRIAPVPEELLDRRVEITGPAEPKMMINALNSGAQVFMADLEDSLSPCWDTLLAGHQSIQQAVRGTLEYRSPEGKIYRLGDRTAKLMVRPRGWHLEEKHFLVDGAPMSASLFDFGIHFFHNARELVSRGKTPCLYLPKLESHLEARLWNDVFLLAQEKLGLPRGTLRATVLIETLPAAFEMDEILHELREHVCGLNAGRWDYIFSAIKRLRAIDRMVLPDRSSVSMTVPFMRAYSELLVRTCHRRGAHAMGGMSAYIPSRKDPRVNEVAIAKVKEDKEREARSGFDGTWVAHPDLVPVAREAFDQVLGGKPNQLEKQRPDVSEDASALLALEKTPGEITEEGVRNNISVALIYIESWLGGTGAVAIHNLMEDAATAEISRVQLWQWLRHRKRLADGRPLTEDLYCRIRDEEIRNLGGLEKGRMADAVRVLNELVLNPELVEYLTIQAYPYLD